MLKIYPTNTQNVGKLKVNEGKTSKNLSLQFVGKNVGKFMKKVGKKSLYTNNE